MKRLLEGLKKLGRGVKYLANRSLFYFKRLLICINIACVSFLLGLGIWLITPIHHVNRAIEPDYNMFMLIARTTCREDQIFYPSKTSLRFGDLSQEKDEQGQKAHVIGLCERDYDKTWRITFDQRWWFNASDAERQALIFHELTHCLFLQDHVMGNPNHYMSPFIPGSINKWDLYKQVIDNLTYRCRR